MGRIFAAKSCLLSLTISFFQRGASSDDINAHTSSEAYLINRMYIKPLLFYCSAKKKCPGYKATALLSFSV